MVFKFEAGEVRDNFGRHFAEAVHFSNTHLRKTLEHSDVQKRGCTRVKVFLSTKTVEELVQNSLDEISPKGLFVVQPSREQWQNLQKVRELSTLSIRLRARRLAEILDV